MINIEKQIEQVNKDIDTTMNLVGKLLDGTEFGDTSPVQVLNKMGFRLMAQRLKCEYIIRDNLVEQLINEYRKVG